MSSMNKIVPEVWISYGVPRDATRMERQPPYNVPSAEPSTNGSISAATVQEELPVRAACNEDKSTPSCLEKSAATIGPWNVTNPESVNQVNRLVMSLYPMKIFCAAAIFFAFK